MGKINVARVILGGLIAGVVLFVLEGVIHSGILKSDWMAWKNSMGSVVAWPTDNVSMTLWGVWSLVIGVVAVWIYAGIRPRFGVGPKTALIAGIMVWATSCLAGFLDGLALGVIPHNILITSVIGSLIVTPLATLVGAYFYKE